MGTTKTGGETVRIKLLVVYVALMRLQNIYLQKDFQKSFQLEDIINNSSDDREQYTDYLQAVYNYIQKHPKTSINM